MWPDVVCEMRDGVRQDANCSKRVKIESNVDAQNNELRDEAKAVI
jgi:hypothetical protein